MGRSPCCDDNGLKKGPWTPEEDQKLVQYIQKHGHGSWRALPKLAGLNRCGKSCRLRWTNYLRPDIKRGRFSPEEEQTILNLHSVLGNKWSAIAMHLPGRTDNEIKNYWNTHLKKKLIQMGFDPMTHRPRTDLFAALPQLLALAQVHQFIENHQWDGHRARLQAEAIRAASLGCFQNLLQSDTENVPPSGLIANHSETISLLNSLITPNISPLVPSLARDQNIHGDNQINIQPPLFCEPHANSNTPSASPPHSALPPLTDISAAANQGDACSISSCVGTEPPSFWSDLLLDDSFMAEFA